MVDAEYASAEIAVEYAAGLAAVVAYALALFVPKEFSQASASREAAFVPTTVSAQALESAVFADQTSVSQVAELPEAASAPEAVVVSAAPAVAVAASAVRSAAFETRAGKAEEAVHSQFPALWKLSNHLVPKCLAVAKLETFKMSINLLSGLNHSVINSYLITAKMHHDHEVRSSACWLRGGR